MITTMLSGFMIITVVSIVIGIVAKVLKKRS